MFLGSFLGGEGEGDSPAVGLGNVLESQGPIKISFSCGRSSAIQTRKLYTIKSTKYHQGEEILFQCWLILLFVNTIVFNNFLFVQENILLLSYPFTLFYSHSH